MEIDQSLPSRDCELTDEIDLDNLFSSDSDQEDGQEEEESLPSEEENTYVFRITPDDQAIGLTLESLEGFCQHKFSAWVIGTETTPKLHYHLVFTHLDLIEGVKRIIQTQVYTYWPAPRPRGFGSKQYNLQLSSTPDAAISYAVKFKNFVYDGYDEEYIKQRVAESFVKPKVSDFQSEYIKLNAQFHNNPEMTVEHYAVAYMQLKAKFVQRVNANDAFQCAHSAAIRRDPSYAYQLLNYFRNNH